MVFQTMPNQSTKKYIKELLLVYNSTNSSFKADDVAFISQWFGHIR